MTKPNLTDTKWGGWLIALSASLCFSIGPMVGRMGILSGMEPVELLVGRFGLAVLLLWLTLLFTNAKGQQSISLADSGSICLVGLLNGTAMICIFTALSMLEASMISMVLSTLPLFVLLILTLVGEPLTARKIVRLGLAMVGLYLLIGPGGAVDTTGILFAFAAVFLFSVQLVIAQPIARKYDSQTVTRYVMTVVLISISVYWWFVDGIWQWPSAQGWLYIVLLGVISTYAARLFLYAAIKRVGSGQMSLLMPIETLLALCWAILFLNERLNSLQWVGGVLIILSAVLAVQRIRLGERRWRWRVWGRV